MDYQISSLFSNAVNLWIVHCGIWFDLMKDGLDKCLVCVCLFFHYSSGWNKDDDFFRAYMKAALLRVANSVIYMQNI